MSVACDAWLLWAMGLTVAVFGPRLGLVSASRYPALGSLVGGVGAAIAAYFLGPVPATPWVQVAALLGGATIAARVEAQGRRRRRAQMVLAGALGTALALGLIGTWAGRASSEEQALAPALSLDVTQAPWWVRVARFAAPFAPATQLARGAAYVTPELERAARGAAARPVPRAAERLALARKLGASERSWRLLRVALRAAEGDCRGAEQDLAVLSRRTFEETDVLTARLDLASARWPAPYLLRCGGVGDTRP